MNKTLPAETRERVRALLAENSINETAARTGLSRSTVYAIGRSVIPEERKQFRSSGKEMLARVEQLQKLLARGLRRLEILKETGWTESQYSSTYRAAKLNGVELAPSKTGRPRLNE